MSAAPTDSRSDAVAPGSAPAASAASAVSAAPAASAVATSSAASALPGASSAAASAAVAAASAAASPAARPPASRSSAGTASAHLDTFARDRLPPREQWPELLFELPALQFPARLNCARELLDRWVDAGHGARPAVLGHDLRWSYAELQAEVDRIAHVLVDDLGLVAGNRVLLRGANSPWLAACWLAVVKAGGIAVGTMPLLRARELGAIVDKARITHALCDARLADELRLARPTCPTLVHVALFGPGAAGAVTSADDATAACAGNPPPVAPAPASAMPSTPAASEAASAAASPPTAWPSLHALAARRPPSPFAAVDTAADDIGLMAFTSGTTGVPKATLHFHRDVMAAAACWPAHVLRAGADDRFIGSPPLAFTFGLGGLLVFPLAVGASTVLVERTTPPALVEAIAAFDATVCFTAPTSYRAMLPLLPHSGLPSLRKCVSAGEALPGATRRAWREATGIEPIDGIGSTELFHIFISADERHAREGATGVPVPGYRAAVLGDDGRELPRGEVGRLAVKGPTGCKYLDDARQSQYVQHGWNLTGDAYRIDDDGQFVYQARTDDMIVSGGYNIAGPEVEEALLLHPAVAECGVVGVPDAARGMLVKAVVVLRPGHAGDAAMASALQDFVKRTVAPYKYPRQVEFRAALPRTETGKLQRFRLKDGGAAAPR